MKRKETLCVLLLSVLFAMAQQRVSLSNEEPCDMTLSAECANYKALHYWDSYNLNDNNLTVNQDALKQAFTNFIYLMPHVSRQQEAFEAFAQHIMANDKMLIYFINLADDNLAEPQSPLYNEELYLLMLRSIASCRQLDAARQAQVEYKLELALKNRIGEVAADITMLLRDGSHTTLREIESNKYILLYMSNPDCNVCSDAKNKLLASDAVANLTATGELTIVNLCVEGKTEEWYTTTVPNGWIDACDEYQTIYEEELYDLSQVPSFYLLDNHHKVLLRDVHVEYLLNYLEMKSSVPFAVEPHCY